MKMQRIYADIDEATKDVADWLAEHITYLLLFLCVLPPLLGIWLTWIGNWFHQNLTTFDFVFNEKRGYEPTAGLVFLAVPAGFMVVFHVLRFFTVLVTGRDNASGAMTAVPPINTSVGLQVAGAWVIKFYAPTYLLWVFFASHGPKERYWPFAAVIALGVVSWVLSKYEFLYGFQKNEIGVQSRSYREGGDAPIPDVVRTFTPKITFMDIYGNTQIKKRLLDAGKAVTASRKEGSRPRNGILLGGDPGNGKTVLAEALAGELQLPFLNLTHSDVASEWVGQRTVKIKAAFDQAIRKQPCVLFIDEIDSFLMSRGDVLSQVKEDTDVVNSLLTLLVDIRKHRVLVVAATNYMDRLDSAAVREGRFDFKIEITPPDQEARVGLLKSGLESRAPNAKVSAEVLNSIAQRWNGFSVKRILAVTEEMPSYIAEMRSKTGKSVILTFDDFMNALRRIHGQRGASPENVKSMDEMVFPDFTKNALTMIAKRLADPIRVERLGGSLPTGLLFYGPPGTGKTAACKALAKEVGWTFLVSTGADLARYPKALDKLYSKAKELRPALIFIDEADELLRSREYSQNPESTNKLLTLMDGINDRVRDVLWVAATNNPDQIDPALLRGGRFTEKVEFVPPERDQMIVHLSNWLQIKNINLAESFSVQAITDLMGAQSIANAEAILQHAVNLAISRTEGEYIVITQRDIKVGLLTVLGCAG